MSIMSKLSVGLLAAACAGILSAEDIFVQSEPADFAPVKRIVKAEDAFSVKGLGTILSAKSFTLDPAKKYQISGEFCQKGGKQVTLYLGFAPYDAKGRGIASNMVNIVKGTQTEVAADAKKGDKTVKVKDASKWNTKTPYGNIAFGVKEDFSDLPNSYRLATVKPNAQKQGEVWEILLRKPLAKDISAGTPVRQHQDGSSYMYTAGYRKLTDQWVTMKGSISGISPYGLTWTKMWKGTAKVKVLILISSGDSTSEVSFRNIKVTEVK